MPQRAFHIVKVLLFNNFWIQGAIIVSSIGFSGFVGFFLRFIGPVTIAPTIALVGLSLIDVCLRSAGKFYFCFKFSEIIMRLQ